MEVPDIPVFLNVSDHILSLLERIVRRFVALRGNGFHRPGSRSGRLVGHIKTLLIGLPHRWNIMGFFVGDIHFSYTALQYKVKQNN
jgi:hypothetical protein